MLPTTAIAFLKCSEKVCAYFPLFTAPLKSIVLIYLLLQMQPNKYKQVENISTSLSLPSVCFTVLPSSYLPIFNLSTSLLRQTFQMQAHHLWLPFLQSEFHLEKDSGWSKGNDRQCTRLCVVSSSWPGLHFKPTLAIGNAPLANIESLVHGDITNESYWCPRKATWSDMVGIPFWKWLLRKQVHAVCNCLCLHQ